MIPTIYSIESIETEIQYTVYSSRMAFRLSSDFGEIRIEVPHAVYWPVSQQVVAV